MFLDFGLKSGNSSVGRASASQAEGRGFESHLPLNDMIYTLGETVYDIIFEGGNPVASRPGGAMLNSAVSLGRMKVPVELITEYSSDEIGKLVHEFLIDNTVGTSYIHRYNDGKTAVSIAILDEKRNPHYSFYKFYPENRLTGSFPDIDENDIILFGSLYSLDDKIKVRVTEFLQMARNKGALIIYDPNIRSSKCSSLEDLPDRVRENILMADIIRASDEDLENIFGTSDVKALLKQQLIPPTQVMIVTRGAMAVDLWLRDKIRRLPVRKIVPVSTIGAGDSFNAGLIYALYKIGATPVNLVQPDPLEWKKIVNTGIEFAAAACMSFDNYIPENFAQDSELLSNVSKIVNR